MVDLVGKPSPIDNREVVRLYESGLRGAEIGRLLGCSAETVYTRLEAEGVPRSRRARLDIDDVVRLYRDEGWPAYRVGEKYGVSGSTIVRALRDHGVAVRTQAEALQPRGRCCCPKSLEYRAYVFGLVWGDYAVETHGPGGMTVAVRTNTTRPEQVALTHEVFGPFGPVAQSGGTVRASLDLTFAFLKEKYVGVVPSWIRGESASAAFAAGYIDAEGSFGIYGGGGRLAVSSYDEAVLSWMDDWCRYIGVSARRRRIAPAGAARTYASTPFPEDLWRINVNGAFDLLRLIGTLDPFVRHARRRATMEDVRRNAKDRLARRDPTRSHPQSGDRGPRRPREVDSR